jgi:biopolymer transport protein ExbD
MLFIRKSRRPPVINIISLIDILVVLLIFYIATTVFKKSEPRIKIVVPSSTQAKTTTDTPPSIIYVTEDGKIFLDDAPVDVDKLGDMLKSRLAADPNFKVAMKADTKAPFGAIVQVLDAAHAANISDLPTFSTPKPAEGGATGP